MGIVNIESTLRRLLLGALLALLALPIFAATEVAGNTPGGAAYRIAVPDGWQPGGPLVLLQHGYHQAPDTDPDLGPLLATQLASGYAVAASGYRQSGWALFTAIEDNAELIDEFTRRFGAPGPLYAVGGSMGGLTALKFAEDPRFRDRTRGVLAFCAVDDGVAAWDFAFDLRLIYDDICRDSGGELAHGDQPFPWAYNLDDIPANLGGFDLGNADLLLALADVARCTGLGIPSFLRTGGQNSRLAQMQQLSGIGNEDFLVTNLAYATFGLGDLLRAPDKLAGRNPFFNEAPGALSLRRLSYGNTVLDARIRRVRQEDPFARFDFERSSRPDGQASARIVSIRTSRDELAAPGPPSGDGSGGNDVGLGQGIVPLIYREARHIHETVVEAPPSHCGFTAAEIHAGWDALVAATVNANTVESSCETRLSQGVAGPCRFALSSVPVETVARRGRQALVSPSSSSSGVWWDPIRNGEGIVIEEIGTSLGYGVASPASERRVLVTWYTYAPPGDPDPGPRWLIGMGFQTGQGVHVPSMTLTRGARFNAFNPADVVRTDWGSLSLTIDATRELRVRYDGPPGWEGSERRLTPLAALYNYVGPCCITPPSPPVTAVKASGTYYNPARDGEGIQLQILNGPNDSMQRAFVAFYTYDLQGRQMWLTGTAENVSPFGGPATFTMTRATGTVFGDAFNAGHVVREHWGTVTLDIEPNPVGFGNFHATRLRFQSIDPAFGSGEFALTRLTQIGYP